MVFSRAKRKVCRHLSARPAAAPCRGPKGASKDPARDRSAHDDAHIQKTDGELTPALARRERPVGDPIWQHVFKCSPCYREVRALQPSAGERRVGFERPRRWWLVVAAAAIGIVLAGGWFMWLRLGTTRQSDATAPAGLAEPRANWDDRKYTVTWRDANHTELPPLRLPRSPQLVTLMVGYSRDEVADICDESTDTVEAIFSAAKEQNRRRTGKERARQQALVGATARVLTTNSTRPRMGMLRYASR